MKRICIGIIGTIVLILGVAMLVLPGPAFVVIPAGLAILATEFSWAQRWLKKARDFVEKKTGKKFGKHRKEKEKEAESPTTHPQTTAWIRDRWAENNRQG